MPKHLWLILIAALWITFAHAQLTQSQITEIGKSIVAEIVTGEPIILDIRAGEWSQALANEIKRQLLERGADIREAGLGQHSPAFSDAVEDSLELGEYDLESLKLKTALLVLVEMELRWQSVETKSFLSYSSQRIPQYVFNIKQIALPSRQLRKLGSVTRTLNSDPHGGTEVSRIRWFEPMLFTAALASMIYLLWTTE